MFIVAIPSHERAYIEDLNQRHHDRWNWLIGNNARTDDYLNDLKSQMMEVINKDKKKENSVTPWTKAERIREIQHQMKSIQRRTVIPYQPSSSTIVHSFYPSNVYLKYQFKIEFVKKDHSLKRNTPSYSLKTIDGYNPIKRNLLTPELPSQLRESVQVDSVVLSVV